MQSNPPTTPARSTPASLASALARLLRHRLGEGAARRTLPPGALQRLQAHIAASERRHTGQIRIVAEAGLPWSYLRRHASARERAITLFGKYRVWDTEHNNGVLIYLLLAEHAIEIVADRGLARQVPPAAWQAVVAQMAALFREQDAEAGLRQAVDAVSQALEQHFPRSAAPDAGAANELPDAPVLR